MAPRSFWKGYLKLSLVTCPVAMTPATSETERVRFHTLNRTTGNRVVSRYVDASSGKPVDEEDQVKGYERGDNEFVMLEDDELDAVALESTRTINIEMFVPRESIEWIWYDTPHYLSPNDPVGEEAFSVIREAMAATDTVGISRLVLYRRERSVMLEPRDRGIVLWTLRYGDEVRDPAAYFAGIKAEKLEPQLVSLVSELIDQKTVPWDPSLLGDPVQAQLINLITAKKKGKRPSKTKVVNSMDALRKSIAADQKRPRGR
jgi:DNA end-binding protein Ku